MIATSKPDKKNKKNNLIFNLKKSKKIKKL